MTEAQELFQTEEQREEKERKELTVKGMILWAEYAAEYRVLPEQYYLLLERKREAKLPLRKLNKSSTDEYPEIPFFKIFEKEEAREWLENLTLNELRHEMDLLENTLLSDHSYRSMKAWTSDARYALQHIKRPGQFSLIR